MIDWQGKVVAPCVAVFGQPATIVFGGQSFPLNGVFDEAFAVVDPAGGMEIVTTKPCLGINLADINLGGQLVSALQGARVTVSASPLPGGSPVVDTEYIVQEPRVDGHGWARLILNLVPTAADDVGAGQDA